MAASALTMARQTPSSAGNLEGLRASLREAVLVGLTEPARAEDIVVSADDVALQVLRFCFADALFSLRGKATFSGGGRPRQP